MGFAVLMMWVLFYQDDVCLETENGIQHCKLIAVHAGLERDKNVKKQLDFLRARDTRVPKVEALSGRKNVWNIPKVMVLSFSVLCTQTRLSSAVNFF